MRRLLSALASAAVVCACTASDEAPAPVADAGAEPADVTTETAPPPADVPAVPDVPDVADGPDLGRMDAGPDPAPQYPAHTSFQTLTSGNGLAAATFSLAPQAALDSLWDHIYQRVDAETPSVDYVFDAYFGHRIAGAGQWHHTQAPASAGYHAGTGIMRVVHELDGLRFDARWFVPFHGGAQRCLVAVVEVENTTGAPLDVAVHSLWNLHLGGEGDSALEAVENFGGHLTESRGDVSVVYTNLVSEGAAISADNGGDANNPYVLVEAGTGFSGYVEPETSDDLVVGFENNVTLDGGEARWFGVVLGFAAGQPEAALWSDVQSFIGGRGPQPILHAELDWWEAWHSLETPPDTLSDDELAVYRQSTAVLKMGQVREPGKGHGQILASLVPGIWNVSWVRDAAYAVLGLIEAGHLEEARLALEFMLGADLEPAEGGGNHYQEQYIESTDPSPGVWGLGVPLSADYLISVTRYFGSGLEESDANAAGPNIEWDNWGLFLWAYSRYLEASGDDAFAEAHTAQVQARVANLLVELIDPATGLLQPDSSIWERHWCPHGECDEPDTRKHHAYSSIVAAIGLEAMGYAEAAQALRAAIVAELVVTVPTTGAPALAGNLEELPFDVYYLDLAVVEAINAGIVSDTVAAGTFAAFDEHLRVGPHSPGYIRTDDPTWYDQQEWVVMDLRAASALVRLGDKARAETLAAWITAQARANFDLIGELLSDGTYQAGSEDERFQPGADQGGDYQGASPMCGFGAGAYILALHDLHYAP